jgi:hypothetical protein
MGAPTEGRGRLQVLLSVRKPKSKVGLSSARLEVVVFLLFRPRQIVGGMQGGAVKG